MGASRIHIASPDAASQPARAGVATFEIARVADVGEGGILLTRMLLELLAAAPSTPVAALDEVPLHDLRRR